MNALQAQRMLGRILQRIGGPAPLREQRPEHRSLMVIDIAGSGRWHDLEQLRARAALNAALRTALRASGIAKSRPAIEDRGDGMIVLIPASVSKVDLIDPLIPNLAAAIGYNNATVEPDHRIRLRVSVHAGEVHRDATGWAGTDIILACRLVNDQAAYLHLQRAPEADLVLIISAAIHHSVVRHGYRNIDPASYTPVQVAVKETSAPAWIHTPTPTTADLTSPAWRVLLNTLHPLARDVLR